VLNVFSKGITDMKSRHILDSLRTGASDDSFYGDADLQIGTTVALLGRGLLLCDCDEFTKAHYSSKYGLADFTPLVVDEPKPPPAKPAKPPPTGYGTEDDSMVSVERLVLRPPKKFPGAYLPSTHAPADGGNVLRFFARLDSTDPLHVDRRFILSYFLVDDTMAIYEKQARNSGIRGGKFLERGSYPVSGGDGRNYGAHDLFKGCEVTFQSHTFIVIYGDEYTYHFMEKHAFPFSDIGAVAAKLASGPPDVKAALRAKRPEADGTMDISRMRSSVAAAAGSVLNPQEVETVVRYFATADGRADYAKFAEGF
jgi:hypothetical protein